jgi:hypothetical protein
MPLKGKAQRTICPACGRSVAFREDWQTWRVYGRSFVLRNHNARPGEPCPKDRVWEV